jgi:hypothetical protein
MRLIDADALSEELEKHYIGAWRLDTLTQQYIEKQPTAYDVEKVVAELEEYIEYDTFDYYKEEPIVNMSFEKLEDIICNGGKE